MNQSLPDGLEREQSCWEISGADGTAYRDVTRRMLALAGQTADEQLGVHVLDAEARTPTLMAAAVVAPCFFAPVDTRQPLPDHVRSDRRFDVIISRFVLTTLPNMDDALITLREHLAPGGRLIAAVWGQAHEVPFVSRPLDALTRELGTLMQLPNPFRLGDPDLFADRLYAAGLHVLGIEAALVTYRLSSVDAFMAYQQQHNQMAQAIITQCSWRQQPVLWDVVRTSAWPFVMVDGTVRSSNIALIAEAIA